jgi:hypothetical protein
MATSFHDPTAVVQGVLPLTLTTILIICAPIPASNCASYKRPSTAITLDIDDTVDVVHGHQQLSPFNAHYDERCFLPIHVYDTATSRPMAILLRPGKTRPGLKSAAICAAWWAASAAIGPPPG